MLTPSYLWGFGLAAVLYVLYRRRSRISVSHVPGPEPESFLLGNFKELFQSKAAEADFKWTRQYGDIVRIKGICGEERLLIADPKALQYIVHTSGYNFMKWPDRTELSRVLMGRGLLWADGHIHKRQRKVMLPGFGTGEARSFLPLFRKVASQLSVHWLDILGAAPDQTSVLDVPHWLSRATLDAVGEAAFDYHFGALENQDNEFAKSYFGLMANTVGSPPDSAIFLQNSLPLKALQLLAKFSPSRNRAYARNAAKVANQVAEEMVESKNEALLLGKGSKDIMSLLVKANASENEKTKLTQEELFSEMRTILLAGHETVACTLVWTLLELARHPEAQNRLRAEIREAEQAAHARGAREPSSADLDGMPYLTAVLKESMRLNPALYQNYRYAARDDVLPLFKPLRTTTGEDITELPIPKGIKVILSIAAYHRNKEIFGEDADEFSPERWLEDAPEKKGPTLGVYGNLLTFAGGIRTCIGWRFAIVEMQAFLTELVTNFEFGLTDATKRLRREACLVMLPTLEGEVEKGEQLPLQVTIAPRD
ncbi:hypothetical protein HGRIS_002356 [Hohenbuehelia grisea]|uniref:Cytochrome P450 n=1 Tax=Hohenbuehelia grisea TaxID=104357 RepID=A0ABR3JKQ7_9AGAR